MESAPAPALALVCDDTVAIRDLIRINLELAGLEVVTADDGTAALARLRDPAARRPDVVVADASMHPMDGWRLVQEVRTDPHLTGLPMVLVTASVQQHDQLQARTAGYDAFVAKPFDPGELVELVSQLARAGRRPPPAP